MTDYAAGFIDAMTLILLVAAFGVYVRHYLRLDDIGDGSEEER